MNYTISAYNDKGELVHRIDNFTKKNAIKLLNDEINCGTTFKLYLTYKINNITLYENRNGKTSYSKLEW
jgi:hypothetical protein